ncbi:MAG: type II toxin-antitoxin system HicA family toxin [Xanthobacteraceae bacterium]
MERRMPHPIGGRHGKTLAEVFERPTRSDVRWNAVVALIRALGGEMSEGRGSRVRFFLNGRRAVFHQPHPRPEMVKGAVEALRDFLTEAGVKP